MKKEERLNVIKQIIGSHKISSQEELLTLLLKEGFELTQATLSRDLKQLRVGRIPSESGSTYVISNDYVSSPAEAPNSLVEVGFKSIAFSGNMAVIKTLAAYSHTVSDALDKADIHDILGTIAGNDTVFLVMREGISHQQVLEAILIALPELKNKINLT